MGDSGPMLGLGAGLVAIGTGMVTGGTALAVGAVALALGAVGSTSGVSGSRVGTRLANGFEQLVRESGGGRPDPEKFCINVWGARIGAALYKGLPYKHFRDWAGPFTNLPEPAAEDPKQTASWPADSGSGDYPQYVTVVSSPASVWWDAGGQSARLAQSDQPAEARWVGGIDGLLVVPVLEPDGATWGVVFAGADDVVQRVVLEATSEKAPIHVTRIDVGSGATTEFTASPARGAQLMVEFVGNRAQPGVMTSDDSPVTVTRTTVTVADRDAAMTALGLDAGLVSETPSAEVVESSPVPAGADDAVITDDVSRPTAAVVVLGLVAVVAVVGAVVMRRFRVRRRTAPAAHG